MTDTSTGAIRMIGYVRVSTADQADSGLGLDAQRAAITAECERRGWELAAILTDAGCSGKTMRGRPGLAAALAELDRGQAAGVVVAKLDRLSRSLRDFADLMARAQKNGWNVVALDLNIDTTTPAGEFLAHVLAAAAHWERRIIGQRTKEALAVKRNQGVRLGRPRTVPPDVVARIVADRRTGASLASIADALTAEGVPTAHGGVRWHVSTVSALLRRSRAAEPAQP